MIVKQKLVSITSKQNNLNQVLDIFLNLKDIHPVLAKDLIPTVHGFNQIQQTVSEETLDLKNLINSLNINLNGGSLVTYDIDNIKGIVDKIQNYDNLLKELENSNLEYTNMHNLLNHLINLNINLDDIFSSEYLEIRIGKMNLNNFKSLGYYNHRPFVYEELQVDGAEVYCFYFTTLEFEREVDNIFESLGFERIILPSNIHGSPLEASSKLNDNITSNKEKIKSLESEKNDFLNQNIQLLKDVIYTINSQIKQVDALKYVVGMDYKFSINFFTPKDNADKIIKAFEGVDCEIDIKPARSDSRIPAPTKLKNNWFSSPFATFVKMYGIPKYGTFDPTFFLALTYCLLFGIMFGDFGQGLVMIVLGILMARFTKKWNFFGNFIIRLGIFSALFGIVYGSAFGIETAFDWFYVGILKLPHKPIEIFDGDMIMNLIIVTIGIGVVLLLASMVINIVVNLKNKLYARALLAQNGLAGLLLYLFIVVGVVLKLLLGINVFNLATIICLIVIPIILIFMQEPINRLFHKEKMFKEKLSTFFIEGFFELFEVILSYVTSTLSFMRVGGFIISHAGMMLVVQTLMSMSSSLVGHILISIIGNIFVMALEGLVVGIQVLRLEYYEMFSRYFNSDGIEFKSL